MSQVIGSLFASATGFKQVHGHGEAQGVYVARRETGRVCVDSSGQQPYQRIEALSWTAAELAHGKQIKIKGFPKEHQVQLFRVVVSPHCTEYVVTNDLFQESTEATQEACGFRRKIEQLHREGKQVTGVGTLPVPQGTHAAQSYRLCFAGVG